MNRDWVLNASSRLNVAILISIICHAAVLFGVTLKFPVAEDSKAGNPIEVLLVNSKSAVKPAVQPDKADAPAQTDRGNLDDEGKPNSGGQAGAPFPLAPKHDDAPDNDAVTQKSEQLEQEAQQLMTEFNSHQSVYQAELPWMQSEPEQSRKVIDATELIQRGFEIARLEAQTAWEYEAYQKHPKRKFVSARTREYRFARYVEDWRIKIERIGNLNYPEAARREGLYGNLKLTVGIRSDGSLESIEVNRPSGKKILDEAAVRIVKLAGQNGFAPFSPDISRDTDILHITRTWVFTRSNELASE